MSRLRELLSEADVKHHDREYMDGLVCVFDCPEDLTLADLLASIRDIKAVSRRYTGIGAREAIEHLSQIEPRKHFHIDEDAYRARWNAYDWLGDLGLLRVEQSPRAHKAGETTVYWCGLVAAGLATHRVRVRYHHGSEWLIETGEAANERHARTVANQLRARIRQTTGMTKESAAALRAEIVVIRGRSNG